MKTFVAYLVTNTINDKRYVGITTKTIKSRWYQHVWSSQKAKTLTPLYRAMAKYGPECFSVDPIASARSLDDLFDIERILIVQHGSRSPIGYNLNGGGEGGFNPAQEVRDRMSKAKKGIKQKLEHIARRVATRKSRGTPGSMTGKKHTAEWKERMRVIVTGRKLSPEHCAKTAAGLRGIVRSAETRARVSASKKGKKLGPRAPEAIAASANGHRGRKCSPDAIANITAARRVRQSREKELGVTRTRSASAKAATSAALKGKKRSADAISNMIEAKRLAREARLTTTIVCWAIVAFYQQSPCPSNIIAVVPSPAAQLTLFDLL